MSDHAELNVRIERAERIAMGMALCGQWTHEDDQRLAALYDERRSLDREKGNDHG
jgi:hypothetical protein